MHEGIVVHLVVGFVIVGISFRKVEIERKGLLEIGIIVPQVLVQDVSYELFKLGFFGLQFFFGDLVLECRPAVLKGTCVI